MSITPSIAVDNIEQSSMSISNGKTLYVGGSGPNNYTKIQDAIDDSNHGDTVFVYNGTYYENVEIRRGINLIGENKYTTIIDGRHFSDVISFESDNVILSGFTIQKGDEGWYDCGIDVSHFSNNTIEGNIIRDNRALGIGIKGSYLGQGSNNIITNNTITKNYWGVHISTIEDIIKNSIITNNIITNNSLGIFLEDSYKAIIKDNNIKDNGEGIRLYSSDNFTVSNNNITNSVEGIILYVAKGSTISDNNIINNSNIGLKAINSRMNFIIKNNFIGNMRNAYFNIAWVLIFDYLKNPNTWDSNYWDNWKGFGPKIIFGSLGLIGSLSLHRVFRYLALSEFGIIPFVQFDRNPAKLPYIIRM